MTRFMFSLFDNKGALAQPTTWITLILISVMPAAYAVDWGTDVQVHGFLSQGYVNTTDNRFFGDSEDGSFEFTELGINASYKAAPSLLMSGQLLSRRAGDMYDGSPTVDYALVDWNTVSTEEHAYGLMFGRIKNPLGLYNDTRDVAFTRPSIFLPQQVYFDRVRNLLLSADGTQAYSRHYLPHGTLTANFGVGVTPVDENVEYIFLSNDFAGDLDPRGLSYVGRIAYETPTGGWRLSLSGAKTSLAFDRKSSDPISNGEVDVLYWIASIQRTAETWSLTAEYMEEPVEFAGFGPLIPDRHSTVQGYYLQGTYLFRPDVEVVVRYSEGFADKNDRDGARLSAATGGIVPPYAFYEKDWTIGLRWDVTPSLMLRAEYQWSDGVGNLSVRENPVPSATEKNWEMFSLLASYRF